MIEPFFTKSSRDSAMRELFVFVRDFQDRDFYLTADNRRISVQEYSLFLKLLKGSSHCFVKKNDDEDFEGMILIWKSRGEVTRRYVKVVAKSPLIVSHLLTQVNWNIPCELFAKVSRTSPLLSVFQSKGFKFLGGRGDQVLLRRGRTAILPRVTDQGKESDDGQRSKS